VSKPLSMAHLPRSLLTLAIAAAALTAACDVGASTQEAQSGLDASTQAQDVAAQSMLQNVLVAAKTLYVESSSYQGAGPSALASTEPSLCVVGSETPAVSTAATCEAGHGAGSVSVLAEPQVFAAAARSAGGTCFWVKDAVGSGTVYGAGDPCTGTAALAASAPSFPG